MSYQFMRSFYRQAHNATSLNEAAHQRIKPTHAKIARGKVTLSAACRKHKCIQCYSLSCICVCHTRATPAK